MKKQSALITSLITIIIVLSLVQITLSNSLSTTGIDLSLIQEEVQAYKSQNSILREKLLLTTSYTQLASISATLGFAHQKSRVYVGKSLPVALKP